MPSFESVEHFRRVFGGFLELVREDDKTKLFAGSGTIIGYKLTDLGIAMVLDGTIEPAPGRYFEYYIDDPKAPKPHVTFEMSSETLDDLYSGRLHALQALGTGRVKGYGNVAAGLKLLPAMARVIPLYKSYRSRV
jgi:hypothetical protein